MPKMPDRKFVHGGLLQGLWVAQAAVRAILAMVLGRRGDMIENGGKGPNSGVLMISGVGQIPQLLVKN
jgi:hypothetical protein